MMVVFHRATQKQGLPQTYKMKNCIDIRHNRLNHSHPVPSHLTSTQSSSTSFIRREEMGREKVRSARGIVGRAAAVQVQVFY